MTRWSCRTAELMHWLAHWGIPRASNPQKTRNRSSSRANRGIDAAPRKWRAATSLHPPAQTAGRTGACAARCPFSFQPATLALTGKPCLRTPVSTCWNVEGVAPACVSGQRERCWLVKKKMDIGQRMHLSVRQFEPVGEGEVAAFAIFEVRRQFRDFALETGAVSGLLRIRGARYGPSARANASVCVRQDQRVIAVLPVGVRLREPLDEIQSFGGKAPARARASS